MDWGLSGKGTNRQPGVCQLRAGIDGLGFVSLGQE